MVQDTFNYHHVCVTIAGRSSTIAITGRLVAIEVAARATLLKVLVLLAGGDGAVQHTTPLHAKPVLQTLAGILSRPLADNLLRINCTSTKLSLTGRLVGSRIKQSRAATESGGSERLTWCPSCSATFACWSRHYCSSPRCFRTLTWSLGYFFQ